MALKPLLDGDWFEPGSDGYTSATSPLNSSAEQRPAAVAAVGSARDVERCVRHAREHELTVNVQATGHGAARGLDGSSLLIDVRGLDGVEIDAKRRIARVGAGVTWGSLNEAARGRGLTGLAGTAPTVGVVGYCCLGGWGWLTRSYGLASARLRSVEYVGADGVLRHADAGDDADALWAYRGGGGVGVACSVEIELVDLPEMYGGYMLWPGHELDDVVAAWSKAVRLTTSSLSTVVSLLRPPEIDAIPQALQGHPSAYLGAVAVDADGARDLERLRADLPNPATDTVGPLDGARLSSIHLDPPTAVPARGDGRWLSGSTPEVAARALRTARVLGEDSPLAEVEIRHVAAASSEVAGALVESPGPFLFHATGAATGKQQIDRIDDALAAVAEALAPADLGRSAAAFRDGRLDAPAALGPETAEQLRRVRATHDPDGVVMPSRDLLGSDAE